MFPGTEIWDELREKNFIDEDRYWETGVYVPDVCLGIEGAEEMKCLISNFFKDFYLRPSFILRQGIRTLTSPYRLKVVASNLRNVGTVREGFSQAAVAY